MENNNSVAFIARINKLEPIEGADKIVKGTIEGWSSIVQKDIHTEGDLVLCITTDAVLPEELAIKWGVKQYLRKGNRVRTVKLKGVYSECILINGHELAEQFNKDPFTIKEGEDFMDKLGIYKYEPPLKEERLPNGKKVKFSSNPNFHIYHKFPNAKNVPHMFQEEDVVVVTRKIHGTNARYGIVKKNKITIFDHIKRLFGNKWAYHEYVYGSHNVQKADNSKGYYKDNVWKEIGEEYNMESRLWYYIKELFKHDNLNPKNLTNFIIYGEIYGKGIQGEKYDYGLKHKDIAFFDIEINNEYLNHTTKKNAFKSLLLNTVKELYIGNYTEDLLTRWNNDKMDNGYYHKGVVISHINGSRDKIMKCVSPEYLIKAEKEEIPDSH